MFLNLHHNTIIALKIYYYITLILFIYLFIFIKFLLFNNNFIMS